MSNLSGTGKTAFKKRNIPILGTIKIVKKRVIYEGGK